MKPPAVYQPCPPREVVQAKLKAVPAAPAVYNPCPPREAVQAKMQLFAGAVVQLSSRTETEETVAEHNWGVIASYSPNIAQEIEKQFYKSGYTTENAMDAILKAIESSKWGSKKIAHKKGTSTSKKRGGTDESIQDCKDKILKWLEKNPA